MKGIGLIASFIVLIMAFLASIVYGYTDTSWQIVWQAFTQFDGSNEHIVIVENRLPRAIISVVVGASLAVAGMLMQTITKNGLASPSVFGINAGAGFMIVLGLTLFGVSNPYYAFLGAAIASAIVFGLSAFSRGGLTPVKLTLAGASMAAFFSALTQGLLVVNESVLDEVLFWLAGSIQGRELDVVWATLPSILIGLVWAWLLSAKLNLFNLGESVAQGLGVRTTLLKVSVIVIVVLLAGSAVAIAGPIGFVGIVIPHIARFFVGSNHYWGIAYSAVLGALLITISDVIARFVIMPSEVPVGVITAIIGTPFFIYIARKGARS
ncbi:iron ABC transporter permease [Bacillus sp. DX4.1]|uniref:FecCD family ABC transporter permease n=1 Tax=Bacillus sp. DX4.1 TaxID=3055867 RepID=UPI0025A1CD29|nr:iron ABC transporter permease [Bacillus sp. DX4.1]MDM5189446.1 iron ABC transporter permease [Bacillus sp. DX4.1]